MSGDYPHLKHINLVHARIKMHVSSLVADNLNYPVDEIATRINDQMVELGSYYKKYAAEIRREFEEERAALKGRER